MRAMPFFLTNEEWYTFEDTDDGRIYKLTDKATQEAVESYEDYYSEADFLDDDLKETFAGYVFE